MQFRPACLSDTAEIDAFLRHHSATSMFLRSNMRSYGPCGGEAPHATRMWLLEEGGRLTGVVGLSTAGFLMVQLPKGAPPGSLRGLLGGEDIKGILGESAQVTRARAALGFETVSAQLDDAEPLYTLDLADLIVPKGVTRLRRATGEDRTHLIGWREEYLVETIHFSPEAAIEAAPGDVDGLLERGTLMILETEHGTPCEMTAFNAILPDMVQIGNVYTPDERRGQGHARRAVALHLAQARAEGADRAILFASGPSASRAYEAIGFKQIGRFTLLIFDAPQPVDRAA